MSGRRRECFAMRKGTTMETLLNTNVLGTLSEALSKLDLAERERDNIDKAISELHESFDQAVMPLYELAHAPPEQHVPAAMSKLLREFAQAIQIPQRPVKFSFVPGVGMRFPDGYDFPQPRLPSLELLRPDFPGPIWHRIFALAGSPFDQDQLWRDFHAVLGLMAGLGDLFEAGALADLVLGGDKGAIVAML